jgi:hypothetical protein
MNTKGVSGEMVYKYPIHRKFLQCDVLKKMGIPKKKWNCAWENSKKILQDIQIIVTATAVRIPVVGGHRWSGKFRIWKWFWCKLKLENTMKLQELKFKII